MLNIIINVPLILIQERYEGSIMSMFLSVFISGLFIYLFTMGMSMFPKKGLPEIFHETLPAFIRIPYLVFLAFMWICAGVFALISYSYVIKLFLIPDMSLNIMLVFLLSIIIFGALRETNSILFLTEIVILAGAPLVAFLLFKAVRSHYFYPEHILRILHNFWQIPSYSSISAATYIFIGYINLVIINRYMDTKKVMKFLWMIPIVGFFVIASSFFIPVGFLGVNGVNDAVFPWIFITDSLRMEYGFIERVLYVILCLYLLLILLFGIITWHIGLKLIEAIFRLKNKGKRKRKKRYSFVFLLCMGIATLILQSVTDQREFFFIVKLWLNIRLPAELLLVALVFFLSRRQKHEI